MCKILVGKPHKRPVVGGAQKNSIMDLTEIQNKNVDRINLPQVGSNGRRYRIRLSNFGFHETGEFVGKRLSSMRTCTFDVVTTFRVV